MTVDVHQVSLGTVHDIPSAFQSPHRWGLLDSHLGSPSEPRYWA